MTLKRLLFLGSALAGVALLQNKERRDRFMKGANDLFNNARDRLQEHGFIGGQKDTIPSQTESAGTRGPSMSSPSGYTPPPPRGNSGGIY